MYTSSNEGRFRGGVCGPATYPRWSIGSITQEKREVLNFGVPAVGCAARLRPDVGEARAFVTGESGPLSVQVTWAL